MNSKTRAALSAVLLLAGAVSAGADALAQNYPPPPPGYTPAPPPGYVPAPPPAVFAPRPPPPLRVEVVPPPPPFPAVWRPGFWKWSPRGYHWVAGSYVRPPRARHEWIAGHWDQGPRGYVWVEGFWR